MDKETSPEVKSNFKECLRIWHIPESHYQSLEVIFRQTMMSHKDTDYRYDNDWVCEEIYTALEPKKRFEIIRNYIRDWELKAKTLHFGFEGVRMNELETLQHALSSYEQFKMTIGELAKGNELVFDPRSIDSFLKKLQTNITTKTRIGTKKRANSRLISFDDSNNPLLKVELHDYFLRYIEVSMAIFDPYIAGVSRNSIEYERKGNNIYRFLSAKIKKEHSDILEAKEMEPERIKARYDNNRKGHSKWANLAEKLNLIDQKFVNYLLEINPNLKTRQTA